MRQLHTQEVHSVSGAGLLIALLSTVDQARVPVLGTVASVGQGLITTTTTLNKPLGDVTYNLLGAVV